MNPLRIAIPTASTAIACLFGFSCQSTPSTSSSSNWVVCDMPVDCADVADAVDCVDGYCVDSAGDRVEVEGSGGATASGGSSSSGGSAGSGGSLGGSAGSGSGGSGSGGTGVGDLTCDDFGQLADCEVEEDCTTGSRATSCCGDGVVTGVATDQVETFEELAVACDPSEPPCPCIVPGQTTADDHRIVAGEVGVSCVEGTCRSFIEERPCGDALTCVAGEICVSSSTVIGPTETFEHTCVDNPCSADEFNCTCALSVCDQDDGRSRLCNTSFYDDADIICQDEAQ